MKYAQKIVTSNTGIFYLALCFAIILFYACSGSGGSDESANGTGSIAFNLVLKGVEKSESIFIAAAQIDCNEAGIKTVEAEVLDENGEFLAEGGPWDCVAGEGTITDVEAGTQRTVEVFAKGEDDIVLLTGEGGPITVVAGQTANAGTILLGGVELPTVTIITPDDGSQFVGGASVQFTGTATDAQDGDLTASLVWTSNLDGQIGTGGSFTTSSLSAGTHTITASVTDSDGQAADDSITIIVSNTAPAVTITAPDDGSQFVGGASVQFTGTATDTQDGDLTASLVWTSNLDGQIGTGGFFTTSSLSVGTHTITASVIDSGGLVGDDSISITGATVTFNFEELTPTYVDIDLGDPRPGQLTSLSSTRSGITIDISREVAIEFDTVDNTSGLQIGKPVVEFGDVSLDPFADFSDSAFIVNFSIPVSSVSVAMGDYNRIIEGPVQDDDVLTLEAYSLADASGALLDSDQIDLPDAPSIERSFSFETLFVAPTSGCIESIRMIGGSDVGPNSVFYDNIVVEAPCEP